MFGKVHAQRTAGKKPVSHQAPIVLTARLAQRCPDGVDNKNEARLYADVGEIALIDNSGARYNRYPEPEYFTDCNQLVTVADDPFGDGVDERQRNERISEQWLKYSFLGIVQTAGSVKGHSPNEGEHYNGRTNVVHAGGTMTTMNTSDRPIETNQLVCWAIPKTNKPDTLPDAWNAKKTGSKFHKDKVHAVTLGLDYTNDIELIGLAKVANAIIGRAITRSQPGGQLDLIMAQ